MTACPLAVLVHMLQMRLFGEPQEMPIRRAPGAIWAAIRHNILPGEYYAKDEPKTASASGRYRS
jgi:hypothetical protein